MEKSKKEKIIKSHNFITVILGILIFILGIFTFIIFSNIGGIIPIFIGIGLCFVGWRNDRYALILFGHICIVLGCFMITWGIYLLPDSKPILSHILGRPLFWGLFSLFGGICAIYHGFCNCIRRQK